MTIAPSEAAACLSLSAAIAQLEAGIADARLSVDLGSGQVARWDANETADDILARLKAHLMLVDLAESGESGPPPKDSTLVVDSHAKALLDVVKKAR